ncbi:MAG: YqaJ viral recombinase family protein [Blautia faecis]
MNNKAEYTPEKVVDISNLSREDWLEYRKKGIGGSDVAAIMGISPFATIRDLFYNKTGVQPVISARKRKATGLPRKSDPAGRSGGRNLFQKTGLEVFPYWCHVPASIISVHACRCGFFCSYGCCGHLRFWNVKPAIIMRKIKWAD